jgi:hypothetical protein
MTVPSVSMILTMARRSSSWAVAEAIFHAKDAASSRAVRLMTGRRALKPACAHTLVETVSRNEGADICPVGRRISHCATKAIAQTFYTGTYSTSCGVGLGLSAGEEQVLVFLVLGDEPFGPAIHRARHFRLLRTLEEK